MAKLVVVEKDKVNGTDTHKVAGKTPTNTAYSGTGDYTYKGAVTGGLSDFVTVGGSPIALVTSSSSLTKDGTEAHTAKQGSNYQPPSPPPDSATLTFVPPTGVGDGTPSTGSGSTLLTVGGDKVLLGGDAFDTCGISPGGTKSSTVAADVQDFVTCSG